MREKQPIYIWIINNTSLSAEFHKLKSGSSIMWCAHKATSSFPQKKKNQTNELKLNIFPRAILLRLLAINFKHLANLETIDSKCVCANHVAVTSNSPMQFR